MSDRMLILSRDDGLGIRSHKAAREEDDARESF
jgi:hypothetical protein